MLRQPARKEGKDTVDREKRYDAVAAPVAPARFFFHCSEPNRYPPCKFIDVHSSTSGSPPLHKSILHWWTAGASRWRKKERDVVVKRWRFVTCLVKQDRTLNGNSREKEREVDRENSGKLESSACRIAERDTGHAKKSNRVSLNQPTFLALLFPLPGKESPLSFDRYNILSGNPASLLFRRRVAA